MKIRSKELYSVYYQNKKGWVIPLLAAVGDRTGSRKWGQIHNHPLIFQFYQHLNGWKPFICTAPEFILPPFYLFSLKMRRSVSAG